MPSASAVRVGVLLPFVDPGEAVPPPLGRLADRGRDGGRLQPVERGLEAMIVARAGAAADEGQDLVGRCRHQARRASDRRRAPRRSGWRPRSARRHPRWSPCRARARLRREWRSRPARKSIGVMRLRLGEREERIGHQVLRVARREIARQRPKQFELLAFGACLRCCALTCADVSGAAGRHSRHGRGLPLRRQHGAVAGIGGRRLGAAVGPGLQVLDA